jgi:hypothetical protein
MVTILLAKGDAVVILADDLSAPKRSEGADRRPRSQQVALDNQPQPVLFPQLEHV